MNKGPRTVAVIGAGIVGVSTAIWLQRDGKRVIDNPYVAGDPRRAAWDEGWCTEAGSDGMDVPAAWQRTKPKKAKKGKGDGAEAAGGEA